MQLCAKGGLRLTGRAREPDAVFAARNVIDRESLLFKPRFNSCYVFVRHAEPCGELIGGEPFVIRRRRTILLRFDQRFKRGLLCFGAIEHKGDALESGFRGNCA